MYPITEAEKALFTAKYLQKAYIQVSPVSGSSYTIPMADIDLGSVKVQRDSVSNKTLELGSVIAAMLGFCIKNVDGKYNDYIFEGSEIYLRVGICDWNAVTPIISYIPIGYFTIDEQPRKLSSITITALDRMVHFDKKFVSELSYPTTIQALLNEACTQCNVTLKTIITTLPNYDYIITAKPEGDDLTWRNIISWIAQITCTCAYIDWEGKLRLEWYTATDTVITSADRFQGADLYESDITITGVLFKDDDETEYLSGTDAYAIDITGNLLIQQDHANLIASIYTIVGGFTYRPYACEIRCTPYIWPLDMITYKDKLNNEIATIITNHEFTIKGKSKLSAKGNSETKAGYAAQNPLTQAESSIIQRVEKKMNTALSTYEQASLMLNQLISNSMGLYRTDVLQDDGSYKFYYHDESTLEASSIVYTMTSSGFAWTDAYDGESTVWNYGIDVDGNAVLNTIAVRKITADSIYTGTLSSISININDKFQVDANGDVIMTGAITWSATNSPVKVQYSINGSTSWHDTYTTGDLFAKYSYDGGITYTAAVKIVGTDGVAGTSAYTYIRYSVNADGTDFVATPTTSTIYIGIAVTSSSTAPTLKTAYTWSKYQGSDASVPGYIKSTYIDMTSVTSPYVIAGSLQGSNFVHYPTSSPSGVCIAGNIFDYLMVFGDNAFVGSSTLTGFSIGSHVNVGSVQYGMDYIYNGTILDFKNPDGSSSSTPTTICNIDVSPVGLPNPSGGNASYISLASASDLGDPFTLYSIPITNHTDLSGYASNKIGGIKYKTGMLELYTLNGRSLAINSVGTLFLQANVMQLSLANNSPIFLTWGSQVYSMSQASAVGNSTSFLRLV